MAFLCYDTEILLICLSTKSERFSTSADPSDVTLTRWAVGIFRFSHVKSLFCSEISCYIDKKFVFEVLLRFYAKRIKGHREQSKDTNWNLDWIYSPTRSVIRWAGINDSCRSYQTQQCHTISLTLSDVQSVAALLGSAAFENSVRRAGGPGSTQDSSSTTVFTTLRVETYYPSWRSLFGISCCSIVRETTQ